jgi:hypothetical protein
MKEPKHYSAKEAITGLSEVWETPSGPSTCMGYGDNEPHVERISPSVESEKDILIAMRQCIYMLHNGQGRH